MQAPQFEKKSFWKRPEGVTGLLFLMAIVGGIGFLVATSFSAIMAALSNTLVLAATLAALGVLVYVVVDPKTRALMSYMYKSVMRSITGMFVNLDPIGILKSYVEEMEKNIRKLREQIGKIRGQSRQLQTLMERNAAEIDNQLKLAKIARERGKKQPMILSSRKAARLQESNAKYAALRKKIDILYRILTRMHDNSEVLLEDTKDQVRLKEVERKAIRASHGAMKSAMSVINGQPDQRAMFDQAMEHIADDVANKVGEMERFMEMSSNFMTSIDLQNGVFEEQGMAMLEAYEKQSDLLLSGGHIQADETLDLESPRAEPEAQTRRANDSGESSNYDQFF
ncbi:hypothetical protein CEQ90_04220 [Lewinellaceae bacterium SD302]|nr:hypothetical protein CEQ90_04220 [Lewinellaceae bacterium SD302]